jgi:hypothetical protein
VFFRSKNHLSPVGKILFVLSVLLVFLAPDVFPLCTQIIWIQKSPSSDPLFQVLDGGRIAFIDQLGQIVVRSQVPDSWRFEEYGGEFHDGLILLSNYPHAEFMDLNGKTLKFENVDQASPFSDGIAAALDKNSQKWGFINTKGEFIVQPKYERWYTPFIDTFSDGMALMQLHDKYGFLDRSGALAIEAKFLEAQPFHDGVARVIIEGPCKTHTPPCSSFVAEFVIPGNSYKPQTVPRCLYAFIDKAGRPISDERFDDAKDFSEGLAPVSINGKWGFIDKSGAVIVKPQFDNADPFSDGLALVRQNGLFGFISHNGSFAFESKFRIAERFVGGLALVGNGNFNEGDSHYWYIDHAGKQAIQDDFALATSFFKGLAHVKLQTKDGKKPQNLWTGQFAYIDRTGKKIFTYEAKAQ